MSSNEDKRKKVDEAVIDDSMKCSDCGMYDPCSNQFCLRDDAVIDDSMKSRLLIPPEFPGIPSFGSSKEGNQGFPSGEHQKEREGIPCEQRCVNRLSPLSQYTTS